MQVHVSLNQRSQIWCRCFTYIRSYSLHGVHVGTPALEARLAGFLYLLIFLSAPIGAATAIPGTYLECQASWLRAEAW